VNVIKSGTDAEPVKELAPGAAEDCNGMAKQSVRIATMIRRTNCKRFLSGVGLKVISVNHGFDKRANFGKVKLRNQTKTKEAQENDTPI
jgi:hypothetical protein